jgi:hypothetical protein
MTATEIRVRYLGEAPPMTPLQTALLQARAPILDSDDVKRYQQERLEEEIRRQAAGVRWSIYLLLSVAAAFLGAGGWWLVGAARYHSWVLLVVGSLLVIAGAVMGVSTLGVLYDGLDGNDERTLRRFMGWRTIGAGRCGPGIHCIASVLNADGAAPVLIPREALARMTSIAGTGVQASFEVEAFDRDPFLWVGAAGERYCIAVWDEKGFIL